MGGCLYAWRVKTGTVKGNAEEEPGAGGVRGEGCYRRGEQPSHDI